jgi:hypothetical protein
VSSGVKTPGIGEPMPLAIAGYHVVRNGSALPVGINRIAFETPFFAARPRPVISEPAGTSIMAEEDPEPSERATSTKSAPFRRCFSDHSQVRHSFGRSAVSLSRLNDAQTGDKNNYSSVDRRAYSSPITRAIASISTSLKFSNGFFRRPRIPN